jgi:hypothetical protein
LIFFGGVLSLSNFISSIIRIENMAVPSHTDDRDRNRIFHEAHSIVICFRISLIHFTLKEFRSGNPPD